MDVCPVKALSFTLLLGWMWLPEVGFSQTIYKCTTPEGETVFSDRECGENQEALTIDAPARSRTPPPPIAPSGALERGSNDGALESAELGKSLDEPFLFRCDAADGETWYSHDPCPQQIRRTNRQTVNGPSTAITNSGQVINVIGNNQTIETESWVPVQQSVVSTDTACRNGAENRSSMYGISAEPCSFVGKRLRLREQNKRLD